MVPMLAPSSPRLWGCFLISADFKVSPLRLVSRALSFSAGLAHLPFSRVATKYVSSALKALPLCQKGERNSVRESDRMRGEQGRDSEREREKERER